MDAFIEHLAMALNKPGANIEPSQRLTDLPNWDSLAILTTLSMLDETYGVTLSGTELQACATVADLHEKVSARRETA